MFRVHLITFVPQAVVNTLLVCCLTNGCFTVCLWKGTVGYPRQCCLLKRGSTTPCREVKNNEKAYRRHIILWHDLVLVSRNRNGAAVEFYVRVSPHELAERKRAINNRQGGQSRTKRLHVRESRDPVYLPPPGRGHTVERTSHGRPSAKPPSGKYRKVEPSRVKAHRASSRSRSACGTSSIISKVRHHPGYLGVETETVASYSQQGKVRHVHFTTSPLELSDSSDETSTVGTDSVGASPSSGVSSVALDTSSSMSVGESTSAATDTAATPASSPNITKPETDDESPSAVVSFRCVEDRMLPVVALSPVHLPVEGEGNLAFKLPHHTVTNSSSGYSACFSDISDEDVVQFDTDYVGEEIVFPELACINSISHLHSTESLPDPNNNVDNYKYSAQETGEEVPSQAKQYFPCVPPTEDWEREIEPGDFPPAQIFASDLQNMGELRATGSSGHFSPDGEMDSEGQSGSGAPGVDGPPGPAGTQGVASSPDNSEAVAMNILDSIPRISETDRQDSCPLPSTDVMTIAEVFVRLSNNVPGATVRELVRETLNALQQQSPEQERILEFGLNLASHIVRFALQFVRREMEQHFGYMPQSDSLNAFRFMYLTRRLQQWTSRYQMWGPDLESIVPLNYFRYRAEDAEHDEYDEYDADNDAYL